MIASRVIEGNRFRLAGNCAVTYSRGGGGVYITPFLDHDNVTPTAIASASALFKSTCAHTKLRYIPRPRARHHPLPPSPQPSFSLQYTRSSLQCAVLLFIVLHYGARARALYPLCVINTRSGELTRDTATERRERRGRKDPGRAQRVENWKTDMHISRTRIYRIFREFYTM